MITSFHEAMHSMVCFNDATSEAFPVSSGVKQGCVLALTLFWIFFSMLLQYTFTDCTEAINLYTRADGKLFNIVCLHSRTKGNKGPHPSDAFEHDTALTLFTEAGLRQPLDCLSHL